VMSWCKILENFAVLLRLVVSSVIAGSVSLELQRGIHVSARPWRW
jgi:hypothetical protein